MVAVPRWPLEKDVVQVKLVRQIALVEDTAGRNPLRNPRDDPPPVVVHRGLLVALRGSDEEQVFVAATVGPDPGEVEKTTVRDGCGSRGELEPAHVEDLPGSAASVTYSGDL
jgi:hypothetical protein